MTPGQFLRLIWPDTGYYCIAHPFRPAGSSHAVYAHKVFSTIPEAVTHTYEMQHTADTYFAVLSLREPKIWDPAKKDFKTGVPGAYATRTQDNMLAAKCIFWDLDVGPDGHKYATQRDALIALIQFLQVTKLPMPTLVSSGGGVHVYWHLATSIPVAQWKTIAWHMRQLADALHLKVDPTRTIDSTSVLRVPGSFNWKDKANPRPVRILQEGVVTPAAVFSQLVSDALVRSGVAATDAPKRAAPASTLGMGAQTFNDFGPPPTLAELAAACGQVQEILRAQGDPKHPFYDQLDNTAWYRGMLATIKHVENGDDWCRKLTALHPRTNADVDAKLQQLEQFPPAKCATLRQYLPWGDGPCTKCRFLHDPSVPNPLAATRKHTPAPPPVVQLAPPGMPLLAATIPNPPRPFERLKSGGVALKRKDSDGNETTTVIYPYDLFPLKRLVNREDGTEQQVWRVVLPRSGDHDFVLDADMMYDSRKFAAALANNGVYPNKADLPALQDYMTAYISQLQRELDADVQSTHLGWADEHRQFILPDKILLSDGTVRPAALSLAATRASQFIRKAGDLVTQRNLLSFYNHPAYLANQYVILNSLASIIFDMTGHHGIVVNCSGDAGASKSSTLYTAAGLWGDPVLWPINGTNRGATANARMQRIMTNANLPTCVDEITNLPVRDAIDLVMGITQPGQRLRLSADGVEKKVPDSYKSAIMIATANNSLHSLLSLDNAAGTAGSMRVFEIHFPVPHVHTKTQADEFLWKIKQHYGHIGEIVAAFVVKNRAAVTHRVHQVMAEIDAEAHVAASERFWSADIAAVCVMAEIAAALQLLPYDPQALRHWAVATQIPAMRGVVKEEYRDPLAVLTDYIAEQHGSIVVIDQATSIGTNTSGKQIATTTAYARFTPHGQLLGHYDMRAGVLYLLKQGFKEHCAKVGASSSKIIDVLTAARPVVGGTPRRIVLERQIRRTLGAGTELAKGQAWCFAIDMTHPEIAGVTPKLAASNSPLTAPQPPSHLSVVK